MPPNVPQPFPYQGSKRKLAPLILPCIPNEMVRLIEPFAGSAAISVAAAWTGKVRAFWLNDAHVALMGLWKKIIHTPEVLGMEYRRLWEDQQGREREFYNEARNEFNQTTKPEILLFLLARCVKAAIRYNQNGAFNNSPDHRRKGMRPNTMAENIRLVSEALGSNTRLTSLDYTEVLAETTSDDIVYMDPPYQGVCKNRDSRYVKAVLFDEFVAELEKLNKRGVSYIISYDGRCGDVEYGEKLPDHLNLFHTELPAGKSTQATLLGRVAETYEALYLSAATIERLGEIPYTVTSREKSQPALFS